jgi:hypothetical protein
VRDLRQINTRRRRSMPLSNGIDVNLADLLHSNQNPRSSQDHPDATAVNQYQRHMHPVRLHLCSRTPIGIDGGA